MSLNRYLIFILIFTSISCGDSFFLNKEKAPLIENGITSLESEAILSESKLALKIFWQDGPFVGDESKLLMVILNEQGQVVSLNEDFKMFIWMPNMGHGSYPISFEKLNTGVYLFKEIFFTMPGLWDINFQIFKNDELKEEVKWSVEL